MFYHKKKVVNKIEALFPYGGLAGRLAGGVAGNQPGWEWGGERGCFVGDNDETSTTTYLNECSNSEDEEQTYYDTLSLSLSMDGVCVYWQWCAHVKENVYFGF